MQWIHDHGYEIEPNIVDFAAQVGWLGLIRFFHESGSNAFSPSTMHKAAMNNNLHVVKFLHKNRTEGCYVHTLFEVDLSRIGTMLEFLCLCRPIKNRSDLVTQVQLYADAPTVSRRLRRYLTLGSFISAITRKKYHYDEQFGPGDSPEQCYAPMYR
uniref:Uncharacterized protein n=1 Tax=Globisporangium ultimum (strain ATCC 200006 / CBS 805.95 / DAOM BR144) TaxID=431595 RepID=K3WSP7_GLOUD